MFYLPDNPGWSVNRNLAKSLGIRIHGVSIYRDQRRKQLLKKCLSASCWALSLQIAHLQCLLFYGCWFANWALYTEGKKTLKKEAGLSRADGRFNEQENLYRRLILDSCKIRTYHLPARILSLYRGPNWVQSHILSSGFNTMLSRLCPWNSSKYGNSGQNEHFKNRSRWRVNCHIWMTFSNSDEVRWSMKFTKFFTAGIELDREFWMGKSILVIFSTFDLCMLGVLRVHNLTFWWEASNQRKPHVAECRSLNHGLQSRWKEVLGGGKCILHLKGAWIMARRRTHGWRLFTKGHSDIFSLSRPPCNMTW